MGVAAEAVTDVTARLGVARDWLSALAFERSHLGTMRFPFSCRIRDGTEGELLSGS
jgi:hypothetical protein